MPAVTLQNSTVHSSQNCGVRMAFLALTFAVVLMELRGEASGGVQPASVQSFAGTRTT